MTNTACRRCSRTCGATRSRAWRSSTWRARPGNTAPRAAVVELAKVGFRPVTAISIETWGDDLSRDDAWILCSLYAAELQGWVLTSYLDYDTALAYQGGEEHGLLHVPIGGRRRSVLIAASTMRELAGAR